MTADFRDRVNTEREVNPPDGRTRVMPRAAVLNITQAKLLDTSYQGACTATCVGISCGSEEALHGVGRRSCEVFKQTFHAQTKQGKVHDYTPGRRDNGHELDLLRLLRIENLGPWTFRSSRQSLASKATETCSLQLGRWHPSSQAFKAGQLEPVLISANHGQSTSCNAWGLWLAQAGVQAARSHFDPALSIPAPAATAAPRLQLQSVGMWYVDMPPGRA